METTQQQRFEEAANYERFAFNQLQFIYNLFPTDKYDIRFTPSDGKEHYDVIVLRMKDGHTLQRIFIEIKIRDFADTKNEGYFLEKSKYDYLLNTRKLVGDENTKLFYINFTPEGTFVFDIDAVDPNSFTTRSMNKQTVISTANKTNKKITYLKKDQAKKSYEYIFNKQQYLDYQKQEIEKARLKTIYNTEHTRIKTLSDTLSW